MKTAITEMFGIKYPIICGAMMWLCKPTLCAAISNARGMGNLTAANYETEEGFRNAIRETRKLTDRPFMVGITILPSVRITAGHHQMYLRICAEEKVSGIEVSGDPVNKAVGPEYIDMLKKTGVKLFHKVGSVRHALHAQKAGYDGIYAAGIEEGGHPLDDDVTTMVLTPRIAGERMKQAWDDGDVDVAPMMVGQSIGLIQDVPTCKELLERMVKEAEETLREGKQAVLTSWLRWGICPQI